MKLRHLNTFLQFRLLLHEPHCTFAQKIQNMKTINCVSCREPLRMTVSITFLAGMFSPGLLTLRELSFLCLSVCLS